MQVEKLDVYIDGVYQSTITSNNEANLLTVLRSMGKEKSARIVPHGTDLDAIKKKLMTNEFKKATKQD